MGIAFSYIQYLSFSSILPRTRYSKGFPGWSRGETGQADQVGKEVLGITQACVTWL